MLHILDEIRSVRRKDRSIEERMQLSKEDAKENEELQRYVALTIAAELARTPIPRITQQEARVPTADEQKAAEARQQVEEEWRRQVENANPNFNPHHPR